MEILGGGGMTRNYGFASPRRDCRDLFGYHLPSSRINSRLVRAQGESRYPVSTVKRPAAGISGSGSAQSCDYHALVLSVHTGGLVLLADHSVNTVVINGVLKVVNALREACCLNDGVKRV